ncbi:MAG: hypothetical protein WBI07_18200 [Mobilitalea sp.]
MLDLIYYTKQNQTIILKVSEKTYEKLAIAGLATEVDYSEIKIIIEDEEYEINATKLNFDNRTKLLRLIERERQAELEGLFRTMDKNPTIKEIRENFKYVKTLTEMYNLFKDEGNLYFSYE